MLTAEKVILPDFSALDKADPELLFHAVAIVQARYHDNGDRPGAECWQSDTRRYRTRMVNDVLIEWSTLAQTDVLFPWHDDFVAEIWVKFRKMNRAAKEQAWKSFGVPLPQRYEQGE